ncbi:MAG: ATP synthase F0 subunit B [Polyangiaceae bacterium]|nr:ATP synthase F0 subunit B [Polyangiaceae bacterium]
MSTLTASRQILAEGGVTVDFDLSLFVQVIIFVALIIVLKPMLFDPMMRLFEAREKRIEGTRREASKEDERSSKALAEYEAILAKARAAGAAQRDALRAESVRKEAELMAGVREKAAATLQHGRANITTEADAARKQLRTEATALGRQIAGRVLGREVSS